jgi:hypothetical protein
MIIATHEEALRRLVLHDEGGIRSMLGIHLSNSAAGLDSRTQALVRLGGWWPWAQPPLLPLGGRGGPGRRGDLDQAFETLDGD